MKLLFDECVPRKFKTSLPGHDCRTVPEQGLAGKKNGELLVLAEKSGSEVSSDLIAALSINKICREETSRLS